MTMDYDQERDWVINNPLEAHDQILALRQELKDLWQMYDAAAGQFGGDYYWVKHGHVEFRNLKDRELQPAEKGPKPW